MNSGPNLLLQWEPAWAGFVGSIGPALGRSQPRLEGECQAGLASRGSTLSSFFMHFALLLALTFAPARLSQSNILLNVDPTDSRYQVVYYSGQELLAGRELPPMTDEGGAAAGLVGRSGGHELHNTAQIIRIARGDRPVPSVVDAPHIELPRTMEPVANLVATPAFQQGPPAAAVVRSRLLPAGLAAPLQPLPPKVQVAQTEPIRLPVTETSTARPPATSVSPELTLRVAELAVAVTPPPVSAPPQELGHQPKLSLPTPVAVAAAPAVEIPRDVQVVNIGSIAGDEPVVAPAPGAAHALGAHGIGGLGGNVEVVAPAPQVGGATDGGMVGSAMKALGSIFGSLKGSENPGAVVASANPGSTIGAPGEAGNGSLGMSPSGGTQPGFAGSGGGAGISEGTGSGSGASGAGTGSGSAGSGLADASLRPGTSLSPGTGGSGSGMGSGGVPGVTIRNNTVTIPSFGGPADSAAGGARMPAEKRNKPPITVIATSRSGGALNAYGALKGAKIYTIYIPTRLGTAVLQYGERATSNTDFQVDLIAPESLNAELPEGLPHIRFLAACVMDSNGKLKEIRVLENSRPDLSEQFIEALRKWQFRPVLRGDDSIEVQAMLGLNIDTR